MGMDSLEMGGNNPIYTFLSSVMASGKALADDGKAYDSVSEAEANASSFVLVGPGRFASDFPVKITTSGLTLMGCGYDTHLDGSDVNKVPIDIQAANVTVKSLSVTGGTAGAGNADDGIIASSGNGGTKSTIQNVTVRDADRIGIYLLNGTDHSVVSSRVESSDSTGIQTYCDRTIIQNCLVSESVKHIGISVNEGHDCIVSNCIIIGVGDAGIFNGNNGADALIGGNRIHNTGQEGMLLRGNDITVFNNRVSDSGGVDIETSSANGVFDDNKTGASN